MKVADGIPNTGPKLDVRGRRTELSHELSTQPNEQPNKMPPTPMSQRSRVGSDEQQIAGPQSNEQQTVADVAAETTQQNEGELKQPELAAPSVCPSPQRR